MDEANAARIESSLGYAFPGEYRDFLVRHTEEVYRIKELLIFRAVLWTDADEIIRENENARKYADAMTIGDDQRPWPDNFMVVGTNGGGDYWFVHRDGSARGLWFWQHEAQQIEQDHATFQDYMAELRREAENPARWQDPARRQYPPGGAKHP